MPITVGERVQIVQPESKEPPRLQLVVNNIVSLDARKRRDADTIYALERLLDRARDGEIDGLLYCIDYRDKHHQPGATGTYAHDMTSGIAAAMALLNVLHLPRPD